MINSNKYGLHLYFKKYALMCKIRKNNIATGAYK